jgi:hypothetical protein
MEQINYILQIQIQAFVNGELQANRRAGLLAQAAEDSTIAEELAFSKSLANALKNRELAAASAILSGVIAEEGFPPPPAPTLPAPWSGGMVPAISPPAPSPPSPTASPAPPCWAPAR